MDIRKKFYSSLWEQFNDQPDTSFLFKFLRKKRQEAGKGKKDFAHASLDELLELLADRNQKLQSQLSKEDLMLLRELGGRVEGAKPPGMQTYTPGGGTQYKRLLEPLRGHSEVVSEAELDKLREMVLNAVVKRDAWTFLYNAGYSKKRKEDHPSRKEDRMLEMLGVWCMDRGLDLFRVGEAGSGALTGEERQAWDDMFGVLQTMKKPENVILPVRVNPCTGVGLYLVSTIWFTPDVRSTMKALNGQPLNCVFVCLGTTYFPPDEEKGYDFELTMIPLPDDHLSWGVTLSDGEEMYESILASEKDYEFFRGINDSAPPGTPDLLKRYFWQEEEEPDWKELVEEGRHASEQDKKSSTRF